MAVSYIDEAEIRRTISVMKPDGELFEIRIIPANKKQKPSVGYFKNVDVLLRELKKQQLKGTNVYITLQKIKDACYSREQRDCFVVGASTTSDNDVEGYNWLMIDLDPEMHLTPILADDDLSSLSAILLPPLSKRCFACGLYIKHYTNNNAAIQ